MVLLHPATSGYFPPNSRQGPHLQPRRVRLALELGLIPAQQQARGRQQAWVHRLRPRAQRHLRVGTCSRRLRFSFSCRVTCTTRRANLTKEGATGFHVCFCVDKHQALRASTNRATLLQLTRSTMQAARGTAQLCKRLDTQDSVSDCHSTTAVATDRNTFRRHGDCVCVCPRHSPGPSSCSFSSRAFFQGDPPPPSCDSSRPASMAAVCGVGRSRRRARTVVVATMVVVAG